MKAIIEKFYVAFNNLDSDTMISCYHNNIVFEDPAFGILKGKRAMAMWQMLCETQEGKDFKVTYDAISATENEGSAHWEAFYTFSKTNRKVHNKINAQFKFKDGLIIEHRDTFNLHKWAKQALGFKGLIMGRTPYFRNKLKAQTKKTLDYYLTEKKRAK